MGNITKSCLFYLKDNNDDFEEGTKSYSNIEPRMNMNEEEEEKSK